MVYALVIESAQPDLIIGDDLRQSPLAAVPSDPDGVWWGGDGYWLGRRDEFLRDGEERAEAGDSLDEFDDFEADDFDDDFDDDFEEDWEDDLTQDEEFPDTFGGQDEDDDKKKSEAEKSPFSDDPDFDEA